ncbi:MAG: ribonuclease PH [Pseudomonadota bacterium]
MINLRPIDLEVGTHKHAEGSCLVRWGDTHVLCCASLSTRLPPFLRGSGEGWVTAEYGMLPRSTTERIDRQRGNHSGRSQEISRLIGRSLRSAVNRRKLGEIEIKIDCDVLQADGGTRVAAIVGGFVAMAQAVDHLVDLRRVSITPIVRMVGAISGGMVDGNPTLDLDYEQDSQAQADGSFIFDDKGQIIDLHLMSEQVPVAHEDMQTLLSRSRTAVCEVIIPTQRDALRGCRALP